jgi:uncharacterized protein (TIGR03067 family)
VLRHTANLPIADLYSLAVFIEECTMKVVLALGVAFLFVVAAVQAGDASKDDLKKLEGSWVREKGDLKTELKFKKDSTFTFTLGPDIFKGKFKVDASKKRKEMDLTITEGKEYKDKTAHAIYELDGDVLKWCVSEPGKESRPTEFPAKEAEGKNLFLTLKRVK